MRPSRLQPHSKGTIRGMYEVTDQSWVNDPVQT
jgi:hypothetical protein